MNTPTLTQPQELDLSQLQQVAGGVQSLDAALGESLSEGALPRPNPIGVPDIP